MGQMGPSLWLKLGFVVVIVQSWALASEQQRCVPGFKMDFNIFEVERRHLHKGLAIGKVGFDDCNNNHKEISTSDRHFKVSPDGTLKVRKQITLLGRHRDLVLSAQGSRASARVLVRGGSGHHPPAYGKHHHGNHPWKPANHLQTMADVHSLKEAQVLPAPSLPVIHFPKRGVLKRQKRAWVIPPINFLENDRGPFPKYVVQIRSDADKEVAVQYRVTGPGADDPPMGLFTVDRKSGTLYVTQPLDREKQAKYFLKAHAEAAGGAMAEEAMDIIVNVLDQNDNRPVFAKDPFEGEVAEVSPIGFEVMKVVATDADDPTTANAIIRYKIKNQEPTFPNANLFAINPISGIIRVNGQGLDREKHPKYTLEVEAADMEGQGLAVSTKVILKVTDSNDNAPVFEKPKYTASVPENKVGAQVVRMLVTDADDAHSPAWNAKFAIVDGDSEGRFAVETSPSKQEGIIKTVKELDFEKTRTYTLLVAVENEVPFAKRLPTATTTVVVSVEDVNEAPVFSPPTMVLARTEDLAVGSELVQYKASDPDTARNQNVSYKIVKDPARWLIVAKDTGLIKVKSTMDREGQYVKDNKYTALIAAYDNDAVPATGTGTLVITLEDVNDNAPSINERSIKVCSKESSPQLLSVTDADGPEFGAPHTVTLHGMSDRNWTANMNTTGTGIVLTLRNPLPVGDYNVVLRVADNHGLHQDNVVRATVCDCSGADVVCRGVRVAGVGLPVILGILGAILLLLLLVLLLLMFLRRRGGEIKQPLLQEDDVRDNIYYYDEEGGGEDDQDFYDLSVLHRGLDNRPDVFRNDEVPQFMPPAQYRPRPANPEDIGNFIVDNLKAADNDPLAPPYDSLLVFDDEGKGSDAGSLSSLNSSSSGDQDYDCLGEWGPRFKKLSDMYGGGEEEDDML